MFAYFFYCYCFETWSWFGQLLFVDRVNEKKNDSIDFSLIKCQTIVTFFYRFLLFKKRKNNNNKEWIKVWVRERKVTKLAVQNTMWQIGHDSVGGDDRLQMSIDLILLSQINAYIQWRRLREGTRGPISSLPFSWVPTLFNAFRCLFHTLYPRPLLSIVHGPSAAHTHTQ